MLIHALLVTAALQGPASQWPAFLGAGAQPADAAAIPLRWAPGQNVAWQAPIVGYGQSSPLVWQDQVVVTSVEGAMKDTCHVVAFSLSDGNQLWDHARESSDKVESTNYVSRAAPTPVTDSAGIYAFFESGDLVALDHQGQLRWQRSLAQEYGKFENRFGLGASLAQADGAIYVLADHEGPSYLLAVDKRTGETLWKRDRDSRVSWSSPAVVQHGDRTFVLVSSSGSIDVYDAATGELATSRNDVGGNTVTTPIPYGDARFLVGASPGERGQYAEFASRSNLALQLVTRDGQPALQTRWAAEKALASFASPMHYRDHVYWTNRAGVVFCFDDAGQLRYSRRLAEPCWATPLGVGDRIYFFGRQGSTTVLAAGPEYRELARNVLWDDEQLETGADAGSPSDRFGGRTVYGVAVASGSLLIRTGDLLYCLRDMP
jgi:outer membrane protein assembly factor BamB